MVGLFLLMPVLSSIMLSQDPPAPETKANFAYERYLHEGARLQKEGRYAEAATA